MAALSVPGAGAEKGPSPLPGAAAENGQLSACTGRGHRPPPRSHSLRDPPRPAWSYFNREGAIKRSQLRGGTAPSPHAAGMGTAGPIEGGVGPPRNNGGGSGGRQSTAGCWGGGGAGSSPRGTPVVGNKQRFGVTPVNPERPLRGSQDPPRQLEARGGAGGPLGCTCPWGGGCRGPPTGAVAASRPGVISAGPRWQLRHVARYLPRATAPPRPPGPRRQE